MTTTTWKIKVLNFFTKVHALVAGHMLCDNSDGRLVPLDAWDGYDNCMRPGCGHYRCEHSFGEVWEVTYKAPDATGYEVGDQVAYPTGCMNGGCNCSGFWTVADLLGWVQQLNAARINGSWDLGQVSGVKHVDTDVQTVVRVDTYINPDDKREAVYEVESSLYKKHPGVLFDFRVRWDDPPQN